MEFRDSKDTRKPLALFSQSSLTDIVLLLLIFFLLTSSFVTNFGIKVDVPQSESIAQPEPVFINVTPTCFELGEIQNFVDQRIKTLR
jgi:biopolymer transport protein ExbD